MSSNGFRSTLWWKEIVGIIWTIAFIVFLRVYILEPYVIPSESMVPTLLVGDHVFVARGAYDFKLPLTNNSLVKVSDPKRGDVVVFDYPAENAEDDDAGKFFVKRVIGLPGDRIEIKRGVPVLAEQPLVQNRVKQEDVAINGFQLNDFGELYKESIPEAREASHWVQRTPERFDNLNEVIDALRTNNGKTCIEIGSKGYSPVLINEICSFVVPEHKYFVMGDNRDNSSDGRVFGYVDRSLIKGRVLFIWFSPPPGEVNPYTSGPAIFAALKDMVPGFFRMVKDSGRLARVGAPIK